jgi:nitroreductase
LLEAGHVGQNVCLTATALGLGACPVEGFVEDRINDLLGLDGVEETALYLLVLGQEQEGGYTSGNGEQRHEERHTGSG